MKYLATSLLFLALAVSAFAQQASTGTATGQNSGTDEQAHKRASEGFDTKSTKAAPVQVEKSTNTATAQQRSDAANKQERSTQKDTAKKYPAVAKEPPSK
jgi:hypothetical protein